MKNLLPTESISFEQLAKAVLNGEIIFSSAIGYTKGLRAFTYQQIMTDTERHNALSQAMINLYQNK